MKYLCLCYYDAEKFAGLSESELDAIGPACAPYDVALKATGKISAHGSLALPSECKTIRPVSGKPVTSDGTLTNLAQQVGAFFMVDAENIDEAVTVAAKHPAANINVIITPN